MFSGISNCLIKVTKLPKKGNTPLSIKRGAGGEFGELEIEIKAVFRICHVTLL